MEAGPVDSGRVVLSGWLRKSPPEKKLRLCAWKKRWFILRNGQQGGDPGVLEYYKHGQSKKPLRTINLDLCEQMHANVTFHRKGLPGGFVFDIETSERTFYLVAETKEDMHKWVQRICQVCGFQQKVESTGTLRNISAASQEPPSSRAEWSFSRQQHPRQQSRSTLPHRSQPALVTDSPPVWEEAQPTWSSRAPQEQHLHLYLHLDHCISHGAESERSHSLPQDSRASFFVGSKMDTQKVAQGGGPCVCMIHGPEQDLCILNKPQRHSPVFRGRSCSFPRHMTSRSHTRGSPPDSPTGRGDTSTFMAHMTTPRSAFQIPETSIRDESHSTVAAPSPRNKAMAVPCQPHKPSQVVTPQQSCPAQEPVVRKKERSVSFSVPMPRNRDYQAAESSHHHQASFPAACKYPPSDKRSAGPSADSRSLGASFLQPAGADGGHLDEAGSEDDYMPPSIFPSIPLAMEGAGGNAHNIHNPRSPGSPHFGPRSCPPAALPSYKGLVRGSEIQPPAVSHSLKPGRKAKPAALDLRGSIRGQPSSQSSRPSCTEVSSSCQDVCPTTQSTTRLHPGHSEGMLVHAMSRSSVASEEDNYVVVD